MPHIDLLLRALRIGRDRLLGPRQGSGGQMGPTKIAVDSHLLRALIQAAVAASPFDPEFYRLTYPDIAAAHESGKIPDLHRHFIETGYFEGRSGALPPFDEGYYVLTYRDVARALKAGDIGSARDHYIHSGAAEGRSPSPALAQDLAFWSEALALRPAHAAAG